MIEIFEECFNNKDKNILNLKNSNNNLKSNYAYFESFPLIKSTYNQISNDCTISDNHFTALNKNTLKKVYIKLYKNLHYESNSLIYSKLKSIYKNYRFIKFLHTVNNFLIAKISINVLSIESIYFDNIIKQNIAIVYENCDSNLENFICLKMIDDSVLPNNINNNINDYIIFQLSYLILHIHLLKIVIRDLNTKSILINNNGLIKLCNLKCCYISEDAYKKIINCECNVKDLLLNSCLFNNSTNQYYLYDSLCEYDYDRIYVSPEVLLNKTHLIGEKSDMWSLGCIIYELIYKKKLFESCTSVYDIIKASVLFNENITKSDLNIYYNNDIANYHELIKTIDSRKDIFLKSKNIISQDNCIGSKSTLLDYNVDNCNNYNKNINKLIKSLIHININKRLSICEMLESDYIKNLHPELIKKINIIYPCFSNNINNHIHNNSINRIIISKYKCLCKIYYDIFYKFRDNYNNIISFKERMFNNISKSN